MALTGNLLFALSKFLRARTRRFKNLHDGDTCYIFGNGASLKNFNLAHFEDRVSIGCNLLCLHNDFRLLNIKYYSLLEPFFLYPTCRNPYTGKIERNYLGELFKKAFKYHGDIALFTSLSNFFGWRRQNIFYVHHFGQRKTSLSHCDMGDRFSFVDGSLHAMIGMAIYLGFRRAYLVGCDYTFSPHQDGHFYKSGRGRFSNRYENNYSDLFEEVRSRIELITITDDGARSDVLPYVEYGAFTKSKPNYRENNEIVHVEYLELLKKAARKQQIDY
jgi:hypothetical protein